MSVNNDEMDVDEAVAQGPPVFDFTAREREFDEKYPNRPRNNHETLKFNSLIDDLFDKLAKEKKPTQNQQARRKIGPDHGPAHGTHAMRRIIIQSYIDRWRKQVGPDFFPVMRLIVPEKDRDRAMYGLKEKALGKYLVKIMKIDQRSDDAVSLLDWKKPGTSVTSGDFAARCEAVISKRPSRTEYGNMTIQEVNDQLDKLSAAQKEESQLPIITDFYRRMNASEMVWLIRIILRQMKIGATEKTIMSVFHPDAETLFNVSSSLRRVCWDLHDEHIRLETESRGVTLMQCYQPELASYMNESFPKLVEYLNRYATEDDKSFWIEEKLDGERIQMHMQKDDTVKGGFTFKFFSRKAKDYTYLYGSTLEDKDSALTQHLKDAFDGSVQNLVIDGEMITWDPELDRQAAFGTLKTAAIAEKNNPHAGKERPFYCVFDILLFNDKLLTQYTLRDRRKVLERAIRPVHRRFELHHHDEADTAEEIDAGLRKIIERASEGLVLKNPRSSYTLAERTRDWLKVKPEYMEGFGESLDCLIIAGYYGSGRRGGTLSSFLCGLRANKDSKRFLSFFKVGGGLAASDYAHLRHVTEGKWHDYDVKKPPTDYITLAGPAHAPREKPDCWIKPEDSLVVEVKAASVGTSDEFATNLTLRFPRFRKFRPDRDWTNSLTVDEFLNLKSKVDEKQKEEEDERKQKQFEAEKSRKKQRGLGNRKKSLKIVGYGLSSAQDDAKVDSNALVSAVFHGLTFFVMTESTTTIKKKKPELEAIIKRHGGKIVQTSHLHPPKVKKSSKEPEVNVNEPEKVFCIADRRVVKVASLEKSNNTLIIRPAWIFDSIAQAKSDFARGLQERVLLFEPERHLFFIPDEMQGAFEENIDKYGDPFYRETSVEELRSVFERMDGPASTRLEKPDEQLIQAADRIIVEDDESSGTETKGWMFKGHTLYFDMPSDLAKGANSDSAQNDFAQMQARTTALFAGATLAASLDDRTVTQVVASSSSDLRRIRKEFASRGGKIARVVTPQWILESWAEGTLLDDERFEAR